MEIGILEKGKALKLDNRSVATSGTAILAMRGGGKSWLNALMAEELCKAKIPFVIIDPEGEYWTLKIGFPQVIVAGGEHPDLPVTIDLAKDLADYLVEERLELIIDLSDMRRSDQIRLLAEFLQELFVIETKRRIPIWVSFEEADLWVPQVGNPNCKEWVLDVCQRGRKRGLGFSLVSQRPAIIDKTALSQAEYRFFKRFQQPQDLNAVKDYLGPHSRTVDLLPSLGNSQALFYAPTQYEEPRIITVCARTTPHGGATPEQIAMIKPTTEILNMKNRFEEILAKKKEEKSLIESLRKEIRLLRKEIKKREETIEKTKTATEIAKILSPEMRSAKMMSDIDRKDERITRLEEQIREYKQQLDMKMGESTLDFEFLERIVVYGMDMKTGRVLGDEYSDLLLNRLSPEQRVIYIALTQAGKPLSTLEISKNCAFSQTKTRRLLKQLKTMKLVEARRKGGRRKTYTCMYVKTSASVGGGF